MIKWPWISRKKHESEILTLEQHLRQAQSDIKYFKREYEQLRTVGFNVCIAMHEHNIAVRVEQGFEPHLMRDFLKNDGFLKHEAERITGQLIAYLRQYAATGTDINTSRERRH